MTKANAANPDVDRGTGLKRALQLMSAAPLLLLLWSAYADLDEVAIGDGKVVPSTRSQVIQSADGGIVTEIRVHEGDTVEPGDLLGILDSTIAQASVGETDAKIDALMAKAARLSAELSSAKTVAFPAAISSRTELIANERKLFEARRSGYETALTDLGTNLELAQKELRMVEPLVATGAANQLELLRAQQKLAEFQSKLDDTINQYTIEARNDLTTTLAELNPLLQVQAARNTQLSRTEIRSPVRGVVKDIRIGTIGGVVAPGGELFEVVPTADALLIEARISPRDIAFIHPDQQATIKITAYDSSIYGTLDAHVELISPDTVEDEVHRGVFYYRVLLRTNKTGMSTADGAQHPIIPGMLAVAEIRTGKKTVLEYLVKPLNRAGEALRER